MLKGCLSQSIGGHKCLLPSSCVRSMTSWLVRRLRVITLKDIRQHRYFYRHDIKDIATRIDIFYFLCCQYRDYEIGRFLHGLLLRGKDLLGRKALTKDFTGICMGSPHYRTLIIWFPVSRLLFQQRFFFSLFYKEFRTIISKLWHRSL